MLVTLRQHYLKTGDLDTLGGSLYLNMSPRPFSTPFLALLLSFLSLPPRSFFWSSLLRPPFSCFSVLEGGMLRSVAVEMESRPDRELSSVSSSTEMIERETDEHECWTQTTCKSPQALEKEQQLVTQVRFAK